MSLTPRTTLFRALLSGAFLLSGCELLEPRYDLDAGVGQARGLVHDPIEGRREDDATTQLEDEAPDGSELPTSHAFSRRIDAPSDWSFCSMRS